MEWQIAHRVVGNELSKHPHSGLIRDGYGWLADLSAVVFRGVFLTKESSAVESKPPLKAMRSLLAVVGI